jgi:uncharacterized protein
VATQHFELYPLAPGDIIEGAPNGRVHWMRRDEENGLATGIFPPEPTTSRYEWGQDETIDVLEGELHIEYEDGEAIDLGPGDVASLSKGARVVWHIKSPCREFFAYT